VPKSFQIKLPDEEKNRLIQRIETDFSDASQNTHRWRERCRSWMQKWENRVNATRAGDEGKPNHTVPMIQWQTFNKLARDMQSLLGDDAEITGRAVGPSDAGKVRKVGRYMTHLVFDQMEMVNPLCIFEFRRILFGHAVAHRPWYRREFDTLVRGKVRRVCDYEGPGFFPCEPDDIVVPAERGVTCIQDFSFVGHRRRVTVDELLRGEGTLYQGTSDPEFLARAIAHSKTSGTNSDWSTLDQNQVRDERERSEGIDYDSPSQGNRGLWLWDWYGNWRPLKKAGGDAETDDLEKRLSYEADWKISFIPGMREIVGCVDLLDLYPKMRRRRPFVESTLIKDGTYRPKGFGALLEDLEDDATANSRLFAAAGELSVWPIVFFEPGSGFQPSVFKLEPGLAIPTSNAKGVEVVSINPNLEFGIARQQDIITNSERVTGITDQSMGRALSQPNAPRTASGQIALLEQGNVRAWLDATVLKEDMERIIGDFWDMECDLSSKSGPGQFFRVTEEQADGLFDIAKGGAFMTPKEFGGRMDFKLKFATSVYAREAQKAQILQFCQVAFTSPLVMTNPVAMWSLLNRLARTFGIDDFDSIVPRPPEADLPLTPDQEWTKMLEGESVEVNPADHDQWHIAQHEKQIDQERQEEGYDRDDQAINLGITHLLKHKEALRTKMLMQAEVEALRRSIEENPDNPVSQQAGMAMQQMDAQQQQPMMPGQPQQQGPPQQPMQPAVQQAPVMPGMGTQ
jgi:hypothetical protein